MIDATNARTPAQAAAAYYDDRRGKGYSVTDGLGPLTAAWRSAAQQTTSIVSIPVDATTVLYSDNGNNTGVGSASNPELGLAVDYINSMGNNGSTEPAKRFYKYARPWRWTANALVVPELVPAKSTSPQTDSGYISGHAAEATRDALAMAYLVPQRFQEMLARALELGEDRILAGMHSPLDVMAGRIQAEAVAAANMNAASPATRQAAYAQAQSAMMTRAAVSTPQELNTYAHADALTQDRFASHHTNKADVRHRLTYGFARIADNDQPVLVPKGAEVLLETRFPYLDADQRRVVLKTTALSSGYPISDDAEGWGRLNLFAAGDGYGAFNGDVSVTLDASQGGFHAQDLWRNDIAGPGMLTLNGSGELTLSGTNSYSGGTLVNGGTLVAGSATAFGNGDVYNGGGRIAVRSNAPLLVDGNFSQTSGSTLEMAREEGDGAALRVRGHATIAGGTLVINLKPGSAPTGRVQLIKAAALHGSFHHVLINGTSPAGAAYAVSYTPTSVELRQVR